MWPTAKRKWCTGFPCKCAKASLWSSSGATAGAAGGTAGAGTRSCGALIEAKLDSGMEKLGGLTPRGIRTHLGLNKPIYQKTAAYGHFGRKAEGDFFPWEKTDLVEDLKAALA